MDLKTGGPSLFHDWDQISTGHFPDTDFRVRGIHPFPAIPDTD